ncbi:MAG: HEAT repeat domain-containing protein [Pirellulales bacterium]|nr:HEAT repeat domain-containing protein [Pirellulales bacterium]
MSEELDSLIAGLDAEWEEFCEARLRLRDAGPAALPLLVGVLRTGNDTVRPRAARVLADMGERGADALLGLLDDPLPEVRAQAIESLPLESCRRPLGARPLLLGTLNVVLMLARLGMVGAGVGALLTTPCAFVVLLVGWGWRGAGLVWMLGAAAGSLLMVLAALLIRLAGRLGRERSARLPCRYREVGIVKLQERLADPDASVRAAAIRKLAEECDPAAATWLRGMSADPSPEVRAAAAVCLGSLDDFDALFAALDDPSPQVRADAAAAIGELYHASLWPTAGLMARFGEWLDRLKCRLVWHVAPRREVRLAERGAAIRRPRPSLERDVMPAIVHLIRDKSPEVRAAVLTSLGSIEHPDSVLFILGGLMDEEDIVRVAALEALRPFAKAVDYDGLLPLLDDPAASVRTAASNVIAGKAYGSGRRLDREAVPDLLELLKVPNTHVTIHAIQALRSIGDRAAVPALIEILRTSPEAILQNNALLALEDLRDRKAVPVLIELLGDPDASLRQQCARVLGVFRAEESVPALARLLSDKTKPADNIHRVDEMAEKALRRIGTREAIDAIRRSR